MNYSGAFLLILAIFASYISTASIDLTIYFKLPEAGTANFHVRFFEFKDGKDFTYYIPSPADVKKGTIYKNTITLPLDLGHNFSHDISELAIDFDKKLAADSTAVSNFVEAIIKNAE